MRLKDAIGSSVHGFISFTSLTSIVMALIYWLSKYSLLIYFINL
jgi:hypothetical protein